MSGLVYRLSILVASLCVVALCLPLASSDGQGTRRVARGRYKMGYMFGKRSDLDGQTSILLNSLMGKGVAVEDFSRDVQRDSVLAERVARHLDSDGDGYVSVRELL
ncbi:sensorin-A-like [Babylonia areolata]|uniref:sensorin-A-like n=1 Tax=Babylonia areolata TaxID=304850 RepID=UPI003FD01351